MVPPTLADAADLVRRLRRGNRVAQLQALRTLATQAAASPSATQDALAAGAIAAVMQLKSLGSSTAAQEVAAATLFCLSFHAQPGTLPAFVDAGAVPALASWLQSGLSSGNAVLQKSAVSALLNLSEQAGSGAALAASGALAPLVQALTAGGGQAETWAANALQAAAGQGPALRQAVLEAGGVPGLVALLGKPNAAEQTLAAAAQALVPLTIHDGEAQAAVMAAGGIPCLVALLASSSTDVQEHAADALRAVMSRCPPAQTAVAEAGALPHLVRLLCSPAQAVQECAAGALGNAACD